LTKHAHIGIMREPGRRLEQAHRDRGACDRTSVLARCGGCLSPAARTHTGRLLERASLRSSRKVTGPVRATRLPEHRRAVLPLTPILTVAVSGAGADVPAPTAQPRTGQVARRTANTPPDRRPRRPGSCYFYCMISPIRGDFTGFRVQVPPRTH
jgi:hypothetical protein